jgi:hypothetical protein
MRLAGFVVLLGLVFALAYGAGGWLGVPGGSPVAEEHAEETDHNGPGGYEGHG